MRALIIDAETKQKIAALRDLAAASPIDVVATMRNVANIGERAYRMSMDKLSLDIPMGYRVTYSHELQPTGLCRHLSVSVDMSGVGPNPAAVQAIAAEFGFHGSIMEDCAMRLEHLPGGYLAVNIIQPVGN